MNNGIEKKLCSKRRSDVIEALYELSGDHSGIVKDVIKRHVLDLIGHSDADIREKAVSLAGIHWRDVDAFPTILAFVAGDERDQYVLTTVCAALGTLVVYNKLLDIGMVTQLLAKVVVNEGLDPILRGTAYISLQRISGRLTVAQYAQSSDDIERLSLDRPWLESLLNNE
ncbi:MULTISPECIES: hypothetical protein [unclassified Rhizobium]|uniref:hypothetical protein n=1 Tax=unclassified Rhizobium TaxID=2613769 RepID=UPI001611214D|nr:MULTISPECIES: hypothetical protein [unclassified Rhizobium]MBB3291061.1 hypothetical protein [Rhizobium sp. BK252]MBB3405805.1 hypothetical protein [Rhizobium sp. BK289]MBB3418353.1 hypothetical protein [Rhizobium sp. BK284]MBB3486231.1 hypothetical protein [Rhizobium sp. BK347]